MIAFDPAHQAVHYPPDRRFRVWMSNKAFVILLLAVLTPLVLAWIQHALFGFPHLLPSTASMEGTATGPHGFPFWVRWSHFANFFFLCMLMRSGLSILMDHPRLYWNDHCTPGTEWIRFSPIKMPVNRYWTAKDDARYLTPIVSTPGYRHTVGIARSWHFITVYGFVLTGVFFVIGLLTSSQWERLIPTNLGVLVDAWSTFVLYANFHFPPEPNGFYGYNALQQLAYAATVFVMAPLAILTGMAMSPALVNHFPRYTKIFGGRQGARSIHFLVLVGFACFIVVHVTLVALTGFQRNMNHIVLGTDDFGATGMVLGFIGIAVVILSWVVAHYISWFFPRGLQHARKAITQPVMLITLDTLLPREHYTAKDISPHFWPNGKIPVREDWKHLAENNFKNFRLKVGGLVENPVELSLDDLQVLGLEENITMHHCIQGWSGIAQWGGVSMRKLIEHVKPLPTAKVVAFYSFGGSLYGDQYYDTQTMVNALKPECLLALTMNGKPLAVEYGAPLRLRVENQLGYKMVKWIERIEFVTSEKLIGLGEGGINEDDEYFDLLPNI
jgi:sulfoxide reductase catalytic subunit YedY